MATFTATAPPASKPFLSMAGLMDFKFRQPPYAPLSILGDWLHYPISIRERAMLWLMNEITDDPAWSSYVNSSAVVAQWRSQLDQLVSSKEITASMKPIGEVQDTSPLERRIHPSGAPPLPTLPPELATTGFTEAMFDHCIAELRAKAIPFQQSNTVQVLDTDVCVLKRTMPTDFNNQVKEALAPLEQEAKEIGDYRADHGYVVLPLVHSTMYPLVYGRTCVLDSPSITRANCLSTIGKGATMNQVRRGPHETDWANGYHRKLSPPEDCSRVYSDKHSWLPTDVETDSRGHCKLSSYVNNLHPKHESVYAVVEQLLDAALPSFVQATEAVQATRLDRKEYDKHHKLERVRRIPWVSPFNLFECHSPKSCVDGCYIYERRSTSDISNLGRGTAPNGPKWKEDRFRENHPFALPEPLSKPLPTPPLPTAKNRRWFPFGDGRLQVIVQINNHILTPDRPSYAGGRWHVEGLANERIVASAIYYYDTDNITTSRLALQTPGARWNRDDDNHGRSFCSRWYTVLSQADLDIRDEARKRIYGPRSPYYGNHFQLGAIRALPGRMIVFPNVLEHRVEPFELVDHSREGYRKMIAIFLVDPALEIMSTSRVPPQQLHWAEKESLVDAVAERLPSEVAQDIYDHLGCPYSRSEANKIREELMKERGAGGNAATGVIPVPLQMYD